MATIARTSRTSPTSEAPDKELVTHFRNTMSLFPTGVTVITGYDEEETVGFTCQSFISLSLEPLLISVSIMSGSSSYPRLRSSGRFAVNFLAADMQDISNQFARRGTDKWSNVPWQRSEQGLPILDGAVAWAECEIEQEVIAGDHTLVIARVIGFGAGDTDLEPLVFHAGRYRNIH